MKFAVTVLSLSMVGLHGPEPEQAPDHLSKVNPALGKAVTVAVAPEG